MTFAQIAEIFVMAFMLSWALKRYGMRKTLAIGVVAVVMLSMGKANLARHRVFGPPRILLCVLLRGGLHLCGQGGSC